MAGDLGLGDLLESTPELLDGSTRRDLFEEGPPNDIPSAVPEALGLAPVEGEDDPGSVEAHDADWELFEEGRLHAT